MSARSALAAPVAITVALVLALGACGGDSSSPSGVADGSGPSSAPGDPGSPAGEPGEQLARVLVPVTPVGATAGEATGVTGPDGPLVLDVTGPDGTTFHAEFPPGATPFPVTVTMRPLVRIDGLPGAIEGVSLEPAGLYLAAPGVLTIDGAVANQASARGFGYNETASGAHAFPEITVPSDGPMRVIISHFSGYGAVNESPTNWDIGKITAAEASELIALERFVIANALQAAKAHDITEQQARDIVEAALQGIADAAKRLGDSATTVAETGNPDAATQAELIAAVQVILASERADQLMGRETDSSAISQVVKIMETYLTAVGKHCKDQHDLTVLTLLLTLSRQVQLLGGGDDDVIRPCTAVEVRFRTTLTLSGPVTSGSLSFGATVPMNLFDNGLPGADPPAPVAYAVASDAQFQDATCTAVFVADEGTFTVERASLIPAPTNPTPVAPGTSPTVPPLKIADATVQFSIGSSLVHEIPGANCNPEVVTGRLSDFYDRVFEAEKLSAGTYLFSGGFEIPGAGSSVLATRTIERGYAVGADGESHYDSVTIIEIVHTPA